MKKTTQAAQVIEAMRKEGGYATLRRLNEIVDFSTWATKTPEATVRRIVRQTDGIFKIQPGLWALEEMREDVLKKFELNSLYPAQTCTNLTQLFVSPASGFFIVLMSINAR